MEGMVYGLVMLYLTVWSILMWIAGIGIFSLSRRKFSFKRGGHFDRSSSKLLMIWLVISALPLACCILVKSYGALANGDLYAGSLRFMVMTSDPVFIGSTACFIILAGVCVHLVEHRLFAHQPQHLTS